MDNDDREAKSLVLKKVQDQTSMKKLHDIQLAVENEHEFYDIPLKSILNLLLFLQPPKCLKKKSGVLPVKGTETNSYPQGNKHYGQK